MPNIPSIKIGNTTYNVKDTTAREHLVEVSTTQPSSPDNRLWIKDAGNEYEIPTYEEFSELKSAKVNKQGVSEVTRANCNFYEITGTNLVEMQDRVLTEGIYYSPAEENYLERDGYSCIKYIYVTPGTTYYYIGANAVEFDKNDNKLVVNYGSMSAARSFTASANTSYVTLNYNGIPSGNIGGYAYVLTTYDGTQTPYKVSDPALVLRDTNFSGYGKPYGIISEKVLSPLKCGIMEQLGTFIDINDCTITGTNVEILDSGKSKFSRGSKMIRVTKLDGVTNYKVNIALPKTIAADQWWVAYALTKETLDSTTGSYMELRLNNGNNSMGASNGQSTFGTWIYTGPRHGTTQNVTSVTLVFTIRNGVSVGDVCGVYWIDSIVLNAKMKPTFILNFDQWWQDSIDNGGYQYCFSNNIPFTMMTKNYDTMSVTFKALAHEAESKYGCENSYYASYGSSNTTIRNAETYDEAMEEIEKTQNDFVNEFGHDYIDFGCNQMRLNEIDRTALLNSGMKMIRGLSKDSIEYFGPGDWWTPSFGISTTEKTLAQIKSKIDSTVKYGGCFIAFTHGVCDDNATVMSGSQSNGIQISDFRALVDYLVSLRSEGKIQICTMRDWYNQCVK